jgi:hypothetical protein
VLNVVAVLAALIFLVSLWPESEPPPPAPQSPVSALQRWESPHGLGSAYYQAVLDALNQITADMEAPGRKEYLDLVPPSDGANLIDAVTGAQEDPPPVAAAIYMSALDQLAAAGHDLERRQYHSARRALGAGYRNLGTFARDIQQ